MYHIKPLDFVHRARLRPLLRRGRWSWKSLCTFFTRGHNQNGVLVLEEEDGTLLGLVAFTLANRACSIEHIVVRVRRRRQGHGVRLLQGLLKQLRRENSCDNVSARVSENNLAAQKLFARCQFRVPADERGRKRYLFLRAATREVTSQ